MAKIQFRVLKDREAFNDLIQQKKIVINYAEAKDQQDLDFANDIFIRQLNSRHDWVIYNVVTQDRAFCASMLAKRHMIDEETYFKPDVADRVLRPDITLEEVLQDQDILNYSVTESSEVFREAIAILGRSQRHFPAPTTLCAVSIPGKPTLLVLILMYMSNKAFFE